MNFLSRIPALVGRLTVLLHSLLRRADARLDRALGGRPGLAAALARYGLVVFALLGTLFVAAGAAVPDGRGQQIIYASADGGIYAVAPEGGERTTVYRPDDGAFSTAPLLNGGSRSLSFTVFRGEGEMFRGDLYGSDLVRGTNALIQTADPGEAFIYGGYSYDRTWLMAERFSREGPPNVAVLTAGGASLRYIEPEGEGGSEILGASWTARNSLYAWLDGEGSVASLTAYDFFERRQAVVYRTENRVGRVSYNFDSNTAVFDERPVGAGPEESRLTALAGTAEMPVSGADGLGLYDPSLPVPNLDRRMAVLWTDGETTGVGLFDPATWSFEKTPVTVGAGSRHPQVSYDGVYVATTSGTEIVVRRLDDGEVVSRIPDVQSPQAAATMMRGAGLDAPQAVEWAAPPSYSWRSFADS
ncbi:hypothetical protein [Rubrobacter indicoceani]|uniref:hypothetical protein n=1 Tax=Rubrobacter indicoceani TaxID=2051957 RepID=UPI000E5C3272|nr:hypothetical protein [Rubrobacter indicoceani]